MRQPADTNRPTIRQFAAMFGVPADEFIQKFGAHLPVSDGGRVLVTEAMQWLNRAGFQPNKRMMDEQVRRRQSQPDARMERMRRAAQ